MRESLRNIGIIAHVDAGKTTLSERILFYCHAIPRMGEVGDGSTVMDFMPEEQKRGITIGAACISCFWQNTRINLVDTPGHIDFTYEVDRIVRVIDGAVVVFSAVDGVEPQSEMVWHQADTYHLPRIVFINKIDREDASVNETIAAMRERLAVLPAILTYPLIDANKKCIGLLDIVTKEALFFDATTLGARFERKAVPTELQELTDTLHEQLLETVATADETFLEVWLEQSWTVKDLTQAIQRATQACTLIPVYCGAAKANIGIQPLLDGVIDFLPRPPRFEPKTTKNSLPETLGFVFKVVHHADERICWLRLYRGSLKNGDPLAISSTPNQAATIHLYRIDAEQILAVDEAHAGDIVAVAGLLAQTGDTIQTQGQSLLLDPLPTPSPVLATTIEPKHAEDYPQLAEALARYQVEDPSLRIETMESGVYRVLGMGELHLQVLVERLIREHHIKIHATTSSIVRKESIAKTASASMRVSFEQGSLAQYGEVQLTVAPRERGSGNAIHLAVNPPFSCDTSPLINAITTMLACGLRYGAMVDVAVTITDMQAVAGKWTLQGLCKATVDALTEALHKATIIALEPIMQVTIVTPHETMGSCLTQLARAHATVMGVDEEATCSHIHAEAALLDIVDLPTSLRSATKGRCPVLMTFTRFDHIPR